LFFPLNLADFSLMRRLIRLRTAAAMGGSVKQSSTEYRKFAWTRAGPRHAAKPLSMILKSGHRFSEKIVLQQGAGAG
jgi:hypothetical protein